MTSEDVFVFAFAGFDFSELVAQLGLLQGVEHSLDSARLLGVSVTGVVFLVG